MSKVWVSGGSGTKKHKGDTMFYPGLGYQRPTSNSEVFFMFREHPNGGVTKEEMVIR